MAANEHSPILVVEDDDGLRDLIRWVLEERGYAVRTACNGVDALALLRSGLSPSLVLMDLHMPWVSGWQLLPVLRQQPALARTPVLVMSGADVAKPPGADALLRKPVDLEELVRAIERLTGAGSKRPLGVGQSA